MAMISQASVSVSLPPATDCRNWIRAPQVKPPAMVENTEVVQVEHPQKPTNCPSHCAG